MQSNNGSAANINPQPLQIQIKTSKLKHSNDQKPSSEQNKEDYKDEAEPVSFCQMFRFADKYDYLMMVIGTIGGLLLGASTPVFIMFWGDFTNVFNSSPDLLVEQAKVQLLKFIYLGIGTLAFGWAMIACWVITGERQALACRKAYFGFLLRQEIGWFDCVNQSALSSNFSNDTLTFQGALGQKVAVMLQALGTGIGGFTIAFIKGWLMSLVCLSAIPLILLAGALYMKALQSKAKDFQKIYSQAGGQAEQSFYSIKTVKQLNGEQYEHDRFVNTLDSIKGDNLKAGVKIAAGFAFLSASMFLLYSLGYWYGSHCVEGTYHCPPDISGGSYNPGDAITVFFSILVACFYLSQLSPALKKIGQGMDAASRIYKIIDREPLIKNPENGFKPDSIQGKITFENVTFAYPKEPNKKVLNNISIQFDINNTALVGESGCGKSTILQLIMRFYDPLEGKILLDGINLKELDLSWLRSTIGYVGQEPVLFATSIRQNLLLGNQQASPEEIDQALKKAEAYKFVYQLQGKLETYVGSDGGQLSGGQKQRIAIARALLKNPKILLLDEATSALDRKNEKLIQKTLNQISQGLTTVTVAHRVRTIMSADIIYVIDRGQIKESGTFRQLERYKNIPEESDNADEYDKGNQNQVQEEIVLNEQVKTIKKQSFADKDAKKQKQAEQNKKLVAKYDKGIYRRVFSYLQNHKLVFVIGLILTILNGLVYPVFSIFLSVIITSLFDLQSINPTKVDKGRTDANIASLAFLLLAIAGFLGIFIRDIMTYIVGEQITSNIRKQAFNKILKMPVFWFDKPSNNCGVLSTRMGTDCLTINGMATTYIYIIIQSLSTLIAAVIIAFIYEWRTALVAIGSMPIIMLSGFIRAKFRQGQMQKMDKAYKDSAQIVMESLNNIRTVISFGVENTVLHKYQRYVQSPQKDLHCSAIVSGFFFGLSQIVNFITFGFLFFVGAIFMRDYGVSILDVFTAVYVIFFAGITIGNNSNFIPDIDEAKLSASHIFQIIDDEDEEQLQLREESKMIDSGLEGNIRLDNVSFRYESRQQLVFKNMNIEIKPGQKVAFVGPSGCGKSTIMQLLQRFYLPTSGTITIDGINIKDFDIHYLRSNFGVVSQEPVLFNASFKENIKYNKSDATFEEVRAASVESNALSFIQGGQKLGVEGKEGEQGSGKGFDRNVGLKGSHISGGQKQRVAIARAILRNPQILLLDQATSALDADNERKVQDSLDRIMQSKTTLTIAHRIETVKNCDMINVFQKGEIVEKGTYESLLAQKGFFYNLQRGTQFV